MERPIYLNYIRVLKIFKDFNEAAADIRHELGIDIDLVKKEFYKNFSQKKSFKDIIDTKSFMNSMTTGVHLGIYMRCFMSEKEYKKITGRYKKLENEKIAWEDNKYPSLAAKIYRLRSGVLGASKRNDLALRNYILYGVEGGEVVARREGVEMKYIFSPEEGNIKFGDFEPHICLRIYGDTKREDIEKQLTAITEAKAILPSQGMDIRKDEECLYEKLLYFDNKKNKGMNSADARNDIRKRYYRKKVSFDLDNEHESREFQRLHDIFFKTTWEETKNKINTKPQSK